MEGGKLLFALSVHEVLSACEEQRVWEEGPSSSSSSLSSLEQVLSAFDACVVGYLMRGVEEAEVALQLAMYVYTSQQSVERLLSQALMDLTVTDSDSAVVAPVVTLLLGLLGKAEAAHSSSERAAILTPCLVLLTNLATHSPPARVQIKLLIFPNSWTALPRAKGTAEIMDPKDAPKGSLRQRLLSLMISLDAQLKRCAAELLFMLCDEDPDEFTSRTGFGNAVALLQIKGLC